MRRNVRLFALLAGVAALLSACVPGESAPPSSSSGVALTATAFGSALARGVSATLTAAPGSVPVPAGSAGPSAAITTTVALATPTRPAIIMPPTPSSLLASPSPLPAMTSGSVVAGATRTAAPVGTGRIVTVTADASVNMRGTPSTSGDVLGFIPPGEDAAVIEENVMSPDGGAVWLKVTYADVTGYVRSDLVDAPKAGTPRAGSMGATAPSGTSAAGTSAATAAGTASTAAATPTRVPVTPTR